MLELPSYATDEAGKAASVFGYKLNDAMLQYGVIAAEECGGCIAIDCDAGIYPTGVIYGDIIDFDDNGSPYLVIFRTDANRGCASADIYKYNTQTKEAELVNIISKGYRLPDGISGELAIGYNDNKRYIIYNEYDCGAKTKSEFYTVMDGDAFMFLSPPESVNETGVLSYTNTDLRPEIDVSMGNKVLDSFFTDLKNTSAASVSYADISEIVRDDEEEKIENVLRKAVKFYSFDICDYQSIADYNTALDQTDYEGLFYSITNLYELGEQLYYVRFATDKSFYNYAIMRRTKSISEEYQLLLVRADAIPLSDIELEAAKDTYLHNKLVYKKAKGSITKKIGPGTGIKLFNPKKPINNMPKPISPHIRVPAALIGGGVCLVMFVVLWIYMASEEEPEK